MRASLRAALVRPATLDRSVWPVALRALRALRFNAVDVPVVWREHDRGPGDLDFERARDLAAFLDLVEAEGLVALVRLGPTCAEEAPAMGVPDRLLRDPSVCARTRRGNPVVALDGLRVIPVPSLASERWREEVAAWVKAAASVLAPYAARGVVRSVVVGPSAQHLSRDAPSDRDHHPDLVASGDDAAVARALCADYLRLLAGAAESAGVAAERVVVAPGGHPLAHPAALDLAGERAVFLRAPSPRWGTEGLWRVARLAATLPKGAIVEVRSGGPAFAAPVRATHALQAARAVLAAGPAAVTVAAGCVGHRWTGALLDERGAPRAHAAHWARAIEAAESWPLAEASRERAGVIAVDAERVDAWWRAPDLDALPRAALLGGLAHPTRAVAASEDGSFERERSLQLRASPWTLAGSASWCEPADESFAATLDPPGAALLRAVDGPEGRWLFAVSASEETATLRTPAPWRDEGGDEVVEVQVTEGAVRVLSQEARR